MKHSTLKRVYSRISSFDYAKNALYILDHSDWHLCFEKEGIADNFHKDHLFSINDTCEIDFFLFNKKIMKKKIYLIDKAECNNERYEVIKSKQLKRKLEKYVLKWRENLVLKIQQEWPKIKQYAPKMVKAAYFDECMSTQDKIFIKKIMIEDVKESNKKIFQEKTKKETNKKEKNHVNEKTADLSLSSVIDSIKKIKKRFFEFNIGSLWEINEEKIISAMKKEENFNQTEEEFMTKMKQMKQEKDEKEKKELEKNNKFVNQEAQTEISEYLQNYHCKCCKHNVLKNTVSMSTDVFKTSTAEKNTMTENHQVTFEKEMQTDEVKEPRISNDIKTENLAKNIKLSNILSDSSLLGTPVTKRSRELMTVYNELDSVFSKIKKVAGRRQVSTPEISYFSYRMFEQIEPEKQSDIILQYKEVIKLFKLLRTNFIQTLHDQTFNDEFGILLSKIQKYIFHLNQNVKILCESYSEEVDSQVVTLIETEEKKEIEIHGVQGDYDLKDTPQEGNQQTILEFDDDFINSLIL